jgi:hypothetical protein
MTKRPGNALIISLLILTAVMTSYALLGITTGIIESQNMTALENKKIAESAATACMELAFNRLGRNSVYTGNETIAVATSTNCVIKTIVVGTGMWTIGTEASSSLQYVRQKAVLSSRAPVVITSWTEATSTTP